ncbi:glucose-inactivated glycerol proton symporter STL1 [Sugiyamaella lignohabitans]|uniref:Glucose-inactivated glycerol proton symporter STL1 n=1 Tax=Sugiyamaella lignohabitans TaxID=796027 RepID=A0A161HH12_9ASCO|nr:glucose-inactivated glycerol proton symporter STL1 [Sugiyamaella lignohabitans]ANB11227.1 glucose-inactivated glycerol proton symporter STL1 [Sugiyamaella lignohabitans]
MVDISGGIRSRTNTGGLTGRRLRWAITLVATIGFSLFGYDQGLMSGQITAPQFNKEFPATAGTSSHATVIQGAVTSCYELGCFFGAMFALFKGEKIGRRPLILLGSSIIILGTVISVTAFGPHWGLGQFVVGRVITGLGNGINTSQIPIWQSEISKAENRGRLVNLEGSVIAVGTFIAYWLDYGFSFTNTSVQWRFPVAFQIFFAGLLFFGMWSLPESPRWLISQGRHEEAISILAALNNTDINDEQIIAEARVVMEVVSRNKDQASIREVFTGGKTQHFRRMLIGSSTQFFQQFTGCNSSIYYSTVLMKTSMNVSDSLALILGGVFATVYALSTIPSFFLIDSIGRRKLFIIGALGQGISFTITFACLIPNTMEASKGAIVGLYLFIFFFAFTILPLPWVYPPEINPTRTRTVATGFSTCTNWLSNFVIVMITPIFVTNTRWGCYLFFALINFLFVPIIYFFYPETAGRSLEEMDIIFAKGYVEKKPYFRVAQQLPSLTPEQVENEAISLGLYEAPSEKGDADYVDDITNSETTSS